MGKQIIVKHAVVYHTYFVKLLQKKVPTPSATEANLCIVIEAGALK